MEIFGIIVAIVLIVIIVIAFFVLLSKKEDLEYELNRTKSDLKYSEQSVAAASKQFMINAEKPFIIGKIEKYTEKDIDFFGKNLEFVEIVMKYLEYEIAVKTDTMRNMNDGQSPAEKAGYLNALHATYLFFYKILNKKTKEDKYSGQELV